MFDPDYVRKKFIEILNSKCLKNSFGVRGLELNSENERAIELVCQYFNREKKFNEQGSDQEFSFYKGLWFYGNFGSGKTLIVDTYREISKLFKKEIVGIKTCQQMNEAFMKVDPAAAKMEGMNGIKAFCNKFDPNERIFDDLGEEETTIQSYGNKFSVMAHILSERHKGSRNGVLTHVTTNLSKQQISKHYGGRIESRIFEMFNMIKLGASSDSIDYRKK